MVRIAGVVIPEYKNVEIALTYIYGVGLTRSQKVLAITGIDPYKKAKELDEKEAQKMHDNIRDKLWEAVYLGNLSEKIKNL